MHTDLKIDKIVFNSQPDAVPVNYRISYKIGQICLILFMCRGKRRGCSVYKIHMLCMGLFRNAEQETLRRFTYGDNDIFTIIRFDPAVSRALNYALADRIIFQQSNGLFCLTESGKQFAQKIKDNEALMISEKLFLKEIADKLTEEKINVLVERWGKTDATN